MDLQNFANFLLESDMLQEDISLEEAFQVKVNSAGVKTKRKIAPKGFKLSSDGSSFVKMTGEERLSRSKAARINAKQRKPKQRMINKKTAKAMKKREVLGVAQ